MQQTMLHFMVVEQVVEVVHIAKLIGRVGVAGGQTSDPTTLVQNATTVLSLEGGFNATDATPGIGGRSTSSVVNTSFVNSSNLISGLPGSPPFVIQVLDQVLLNIGAANDRFLAIGGLGGLAGKAMVSPVTVGTNRNGGAVADYASPTEMIGGGGRGRSNTRSTDSNNAQDNTLVIPASNGITGLVIIYY
jgi:hypothetical protein